MEFPTSHFKSVLVTTSINCCSYLTPLESDMFLAIAALCVEQKFNHRNWKMVTGDAIPELEMQKFGWLEFSIVISIGMNVTQLSS